ncbi:MAG TPA: ATP-binding protein [Rectinemataceae bacterium]|nr:ATP-binding protein [Rectinemataceae bacterium]
MDQRLWIPRPSYLEALAPFSDGELIKVLLGQRRVGKSGLLHLVEADWRARHPERAVAFIDKEKDEWTSIQTGEDLLAAARALGGSPAGRSLILVDEVQEIEGFAAALRSLAAEGRWDLYVTGSNARLLSGELATLFAGRAITLLVHALSYEEFLSFNGRKDSDESLLLYLRYGGLPYLARLPDSDAARIGYLEAIVDTVVLRDVIERFGVRNAPFLRNLVRYCADSIGSLLSAKRIADYLKSQLQKVSPQIVIEYLSHLEAAFLIHRCPRYDIQGRKIFEIGEKIYFEDLGLRTALRGWRQTDLGKVVENAVYLKLIQDGWKPSVGVLGDREVDFVATRGASTIYVQSALSVAGDETREREFGNLLRIDDNHPKYVVSLDTLRADDKGIHHLSLREFLMASL